MGRALRLLLVTIVASGLISVALAGGCYSPAIESCQYACAGTQSLCPDGLVCNAQRMCVSQVSERCNSINDAAVDLLGKPDVAPPDGVTMPDAGMAPG